ncbi:MAG: hypothetical protein H7Y09_04750 [Chitinophagaceae bacterium]|nr:hypothetical protein [Anaerolineae bacterium]
MLSVHQSTRVSTPFDDLITYFGQIATPEEILAFKASPESEERTQELLYKNQDGTLTLDEFIELQQMIHLERKLGALKAKALERLSES